MCCQNTNPSTGRFVTGMYASTCGCGCMGREPNSWHLENYKEYLKAELVSVEKRIQDIQKTKS